MMPIRNTSLWRNYERFDRARGRLVATVLASRLDLDGARIADVGSGTGGVSLILAEKGAVVRAIDIDAGRLEHLNRRKDQLPIETMRTAAEDWQDGEEVYDAAVLLDVLEHVRDPHTVLGNIRRKLKITGILYISTPNRHSFFNLVSDPHFSLPFISLCRRKQVARIVSQLLKWQRVDRPDFPQLLKLADLAFLLRRHQFTWRFINREVLRIALKDPESLWNRGWHLRCMRALVRAGMGKLLIDLVSDDVGPFNLWLNATWFILARPEIVH